MSPGPARLNLASLLLASAAVIATACGGDGDSSPTSQTTSGAPAASTPSAATIDLAETQPVFSATGSGAQDLVSTSSNVASGDLNDDGKTDLIVGAPNADGPEGSRQDAGVTYVLLGPLDGEADLSSTEVAFSVTGAAAGDHLGASVLAADVNGDGVDDLVVGATGVTGGVDPRTDQGRVYVFLGGDLEGEADLASDESDFMVTGAEGFSLLGYSLAAGDVNGDEIADLVLGAPFAGREPGSPPGSPRTSVGEVYVVLGSAELSGEVRTDLLAQDATLSGIEEFGQFGASVATGDVDGDGTDDVVVGAHRASPAGQERAVSGAVYLFSGGEDLAGRLTVGDGREGDQAATILGPAANIGFGFPVVAGDFNGDGEADIGAGAQLEPTDQGQVVGSFRVILGNSPLDSVIDLAETSPEMLVVGARAGELLPTSAAAGDVNADGVDDLVLGATLGQGPEGRDSSGTAYILFGRSGGATEIELASGGYDIVVFGAESGDRLGASVAAISRGGDAANGVLLLAPEADAAGQADAGRVYLVTAGGEDDS